jgi:3-hydroxyisobutyrate dehydrogenase-like beta-hydroxyacid dehydrogenase
VRVAFVGLGDMGLGMATCLVKAGFEVAGFDLRQERLAQFTAAGGHAAPSAQAAAVGAEAAVVIPFDGPQTEDILLGPDGVLTSLPSGSVVLAMSTMGPAIMRSIAERLGDYLLVDAPVTGGAARANTGELTAIAAGSEEAMAKARPLLDAMCSNVFVMGTEPGAGQIAKLINQLLVGVHLTATGEAFALASAAGVDPKQLYDMLVTGMARSEVLVLRGASVVEGNLQTGGNMSIFIKDLSLVQDLARELHVPLFTASAAFNLFQFGTQMGRGREDDAALIALLADLARPKG